MRNETALGNVDCLIEGVLAVLSQLLLGHRTCNGVTSMQKPCAAFLPVVLLCKHCCYNSCAPRFFHPHISFVAYAKLSKTYVFMCAECYASGPASEESLCLCWAWWELDAAGYLLVWYDTTQLTQELILHCLAVPFSRSSYISHHTFGIQISVVSIWIFRLSHLNWGTLNCLLEGKSCFSPLLLDLCMAAYQ